MGSKGIKKLRIKLIGLYNPSNSRGFTKETDILFHPEQYVQILHKLGFCSALLSFNLICKEILYCSITFRLNNSEIPNSSVIFEN